MTYRLRGTWRRQALIAAALVAAFVVFVQLRAQAGPQLAGFATWIEGLGVWAPLAFVAGYALAVVAFVPGSLLTLAGGALFGVLAGTVYVFTAATLGACAAFLISRHVARGWVEQRLAGNPRFAAIDRAIAEQGLRIAFLLRLSPVFPFNLLNYALGLTRVRFSDYAMACLGMLPATLAYVYLGALIGDLAGLGAAEPARGPVWVQRGLTALGVAATLAASVLIARTASRAIEAATRDTPPDGRG